MKHPSFHKFETDGAEGVVCKTWHNMKWNIRIQTIKSKNLQPVPCKPVTSIFERRRAGAINHIKNTESEAVTTCGDVILHRSNMDDDSMHHRALFCRRWGWAVRLQQLHVLIFGTLEGSFTHTCTRRYLIKGEKVIKFLTGIISKYLQQTKCMPKKGKISVQIHKRIKSTYHLP